MDEVGAFQHARGRTPRHRLCGRSEAGGRASCLCIKEGAVSAFQISNLDIPRPRSDHKLLHITCTARSLLTSDPIIKQLSPILSNHIVHALTALVVLAFKSLPCSHSCNPLPYSHA